MGKKFKKSLTKLGMKQVTGINRVTLKTSKNFVLYIEDPDILKSTDNAYVIFGECKMFDYGQNFPLIKPQLSKNQTKLSQPRLLPISQRLRSKMRVKPMTKTLEISRREH